MRHARVITLVSYIIIVTLGFLLGRVYEELRDDGIIRDESLLYLPPANRKF